MRTTLLAILIAAAFGSSAAVAEKIRVEFTWYVSGSYTVIGEFSGEDEDRDMAISSVEVSSLRFEVIQNGAVIAHASGRQAMRGSQNHDFNFNFDLRSMAFMRGHSLKGRGQLWNYDGPGAGFFSGATSEAIRIDGATVKPSRKWAIRS